MPIQKMKNRDVTNELSKITWIGCEVKAYNKKTEDKIKGIVMDETKNTIKIKVKKIKEKDKKTEKSRIVSLIKNDSLFEIKLNDKKFIVDGNLINGRIEKRIKR